MTGSGCRCSNTAPLKSDEWINRCLITTVADFLVRNTLLPQSDADVRPRHRLHTRQTRKRDRPVNLLSRFPSALTLVERTDVSKPWGIDCRDSIQRTRGQSPHWRKNLSVLTNRPTAVMASNRRRNSISISKQSINNNRRKNSLTLDHSSLDSEDTFKSAYFP